MQVKPAAAYYEARPWVRHYDDGVPAVLSYPAIPLHQCLRDTANRLPDAPALITSAKLPVIGRQVSSLTYRQLDAASDALAAGLMKLGLKKGDRVAIVMPNCAAFAISFFAVLKAGGVVAAANPTYPPDKMQYQINDCNASIVITLTTFYNMLKQIQPQTQVKHVIAANIKEYLPPLARTLFTIAREKKDGHFLADVQQGDFWFQALLRQHAGQKPDVAVTAEDTALFQYTGGTTGVSKAAVSQHKALIANMLQMDAIMRAFNVPGEKEIILGAIPMFHVYGLIIVLSLGVYKGARTVLIPNARDIDEVVACIEYFQPTLLPGVPALYNAINNHPRVQSGKVKMQSLRYCISGSAPLPSATKEEFERLSGAKVREGFGMSEIPTATHVNPVYKENRPNSIGLPLPDVECRIVSLDDGETEVPVGEVGELIIHAPNLMLGYHQMPTETANALREKDGRRWMYTGDIARMDEDGYFYIVDRKKDMALIGGFNVYPTTVENVIKSHPAVLEVGVAAISHPDRPGQEALKAWIVRKPGHDVTEQEIIAYCSQKLAPYEVPRRIAFIAELPKSAVGKTLRRELIQMEMKDA